jgi:hypothetical protein
MERVGCGSSEPGCADGMWPVVGISWLVLMTSVHERTDSVLIAVLMHGSLTASTLILSPRTAGAPLLAYGVAFAASIWATSATLNIVGTKRVVARARAWNVAG